mmetsp:Transcript_17575/g.26175  ORF Transcript_17575/g.26175 Transcript_17575/m.26175 type:complete len:535 (-) Transcript_17575:164-1768(-)|eukprot:CAMPEP_0116026356 /NCGR_PEP_ID=MMETSP0321-20121206/13778_1 /TAXON_ID=163516 /ORGANISM="Leptocylindrus danicus var. danicus, Strain B650" /LENGTH=534 /DNA_ID=CAMNT_0003499091 /DNA_START=40 /DNA_END=1644 /DNA_ORIENTATION=+
MRRGELFMAKAGLFIFMVCRGHAWSPSLQLRTTTTTTINTVLHMSDRAATTTTTRRPKKTVRDRTNEEAVSLIRDVVQAGIEAGPRAGVIRSLQAYYAVTSTVADFLPINGRPAAEDQFSAPVALRKLFERLGATYVKLGQFVASSPTLFPKEYVTEFQKCLDSTEPIDWNIIKGVIETELGPISKTFASVDKEPLASASIAQVHRATLKTGEEVVLKVQKPRIDSVLKADLNFIFVASRVLEFLQPDFERTSLSGIASDIKTSMLEELDFQKEATNVEEFREFLTVNGLSSVATAPRIYREYTSKKVMTMEYLRGVSLLDAESIAKITKDPEATIITALNVWTTSVMTMPWFHADVHAGNLLVLEDGRVGFIDFGIVGRVSEKTFKAVNELSAALAAGDFNGMAQALVNMGATDEEVDIDKFGNDIQRVLVNLSEVQPDVTVAATADGQILGSLDFDEQEITQILLDIVDVTEDNGLKLPREFGLLVKQSLYFDRYLKILAPGLDVMSDARVADLGGRTTPPGATDAEVIVDV